jgi:UDP-2,3-diacylglucosamine pyrophosphatase LpxH
LSGKRYLAIHGHQFDHFLRDNRMICDLATWIYDKAQSVDVKKRRFSRLLKRLSKRWLQVSQQVAERAAHYASIQGADFVFCGHTHHATALEIADVNYFNSGCWTDTPSHFITIDELAGVKIHAHG